MIKAILIDSSTGKALDSQPCFSGELTLLTESCLKLNSKWRTVTNTAAETLNAVSPLPGKAVFITDIVVSSSKKVNSSTVKVQFNDGVNTIPIIELEGASDPIAFSHSFIGGLMGWQGAAIQVITNQAAMSVTTLIGYVNIIESIAKPYNLWYAER